MGGAWLGEVEGLNRKNTVLEFCFFILGIAFDFGVRLVVGLALVLLFCFGSRLWLSSLFWGDFGDNGVWFRCCWWCCLC